ncbi:hypothetical protein Afil01_06450 [Actinorhabdospora filicis]|uniref:Uncharacterized protein n=1 Tax=Actinorhabdospora filicis TaxID=1785913 RepID=A0A9W6SH06_9ACTN|nr:hypothetical protein [Actinorhabdospora filicis]GLZ75838.1 hypothetical protein Afil01_06450 [Actinorhabdospora filicis]
MTTIFQVLIPVLGLLALVAFIGGGLLIPLFDISEERAERKREAVR